MFGSGTLVNRDTMLGPDMPSYALWPGRVNHILVAGIELDLYCRNSRDAATYLMDHRYPPSVPPDSRTESSGTSLTTTGTVSLPSVPPELANRLYLLRNRCYQPYPSSMTQQDALNKRLTLLRPLPVDGPFIPDESVRVIGGALGLVSRYQEDIFSIEEVCELATPQLHQFGVVHNDICLSTVFVSGPFDPDSDILLAGFSEATGDMTRARNDCFQVFQTVQEFLGQRVKLPKFWTGDEHLDGLWQHLSEFSGDNWPCTAQEVCSRSDISLSPDMDEPKVISVSKGFEFRHTSQQDVSYLDVRDVKEYLTKDAVRSAGRAPSTAQVKSLIKTAFAALEPCIRDGTVTAKDYSYFKDHMWERHANYNLGLRLFLALPSEYYIKKPIQFSLSFPVPYLSRYGLVNFEYLRNLASTEFDPNILKHLLPFCVEIRGFPEARGVYISVTHLDVIAEHLGLRIEDDNYYDAIDPLDTSLDEYTYQEWYLLAPHPLSRIFPVQRATNQVLTSPTPPTYTPLGHFLTDHFDAKTYLDADVVHNPEHLFIINNNNTPQPLPNSCGGSVEATSDDWLFGRFRPSALPPPSLLLETKAKRKAEETDAWIREQEEARRARRRGRKRGDMVMTEFGSKG
ncbi:hypothetical protein F5144DRAFT_547055 [Chaetomium tenue]|uniref:Uncharacterized protein n=1 Tax=Chaetomium tenue TaxID=1854479 RepID=A0ACB7PFD9_9PEZI|nr:hypothetical protein F5144DRAFT_547055 [Chaetomium globosum]